MMASQIQVGGRALIGATPVALRIDGAELYCRAARVDKVQAPHNHSHNRGQHLSSVRQKILSGKRESRRQLAALPFAQKLILLEKLRDRSLLVASSSLRQKWQAAHRKPER
jgi:hypothetical protein